MIVRVDGLAMRVRGPKGAPPVLVIGPGPGFPFLHEAPALERSLALQTRRVLYVEQRGCGRSRTPDAPTPTIERSIDDVRTAARWIAEDAGAPPVAIGISLGASYAIAAAARDPSPFRAVIGLGTDVDIAAADAEAHAFVLETATARGDRRALAAAPRFAAPVTTSRAFQVRAKWLTQLDGMLPGARWRTLLRRTLFGLVRGYGLIGAVRALAAMTRVQDALLPALSTWHLRDVRALGVPVALIHGARDAVSPPALVQAWLGALTAPAASLRILDGVGHLPHVERPAAVREVLDEYAVAR